MKKRNSIFVLFIMWHFLNITNGLLTDQNNTLPSYHFIPGTDGLYKYHDTPLKWRSAVETCETENAILFHPMDEKELTTVGSFWRNLENNFPNVLWLGVSKSDNGFNTVTGVPISNTFNIWTEHQAEIGYEDCVETLHTSNSTWELYARECSKKMPFICKMAIINPNNQTRISIDNEVMPLYQISYPGYHFIPGTNGLYKYHKKLREWQAAVVICDEEGGTLFYPADENELNTVIRYWQNIEKENFPGRLMLDLKKGKNGFRTMSGIPISKVFNKWTPGEPNNIYGKENCVETKPNSNNSWAINDICCWVTRQYICKIAIKQDDQPSTLNFGYRYSELLGKAYKLHLTPKSWNEARVACQAEASDLAVINSSEEAVHLVGLMNNINDLTPGNFRNEVVLLGFHKQNVECWQTVQGKSLSSIKYRQPWAKRQPGSENGEECGAMFYNGHLTDISCGRKALFVCEKIISEHTPTTTRY